MFKNDSIRLENFSQRDFFSALRNNFKKQKLKINVTFLHPKRLSENISEEYNWQQKGCP